MARGSVNAVSPLMLFVQFATHFFDCACRVGILGHTFETIFERSEILVAHIFEPYILRARTFGGSYELVEFDLDGFAVSVLSVLDEEHHQKGDDGGAGVNDKLPCVREVEQGACD